MIPCADGDDSAVMGESIESKRACSPSFGSIDMAPKGHLLRRIDAFATSELCDFHKELGAFYSDIGRPSIDPELLIRIPAI
jgi:hypothetical protein